MTFRDRHVIALIPARGGSKGVKCKNLRTVLGKPLFAHTIQAARDAACVDQIYVSSDDAEILRLAREMGVDVVPRAVEAATDAATANDVVIDFLQHFSKALIATNPYLIFLQPTSPLRTGAHIDAAFDTMSSAGSDMCLSVAELKKTPFKSFTLTPNGRLQSLFNEELTSANRQSLPTVYYPNGAIYIFPFSNFLEHNIFPSNGSVPFIMSERESVDIDTEEDIVMLEKLCRAN